MKFTLKYTALFVLLLLLGCGHLFDKCGDNVLIGEYEVSPESLADWHPYRNADH